MVDIDERVVSMKFDSNDFEKKSKTTLDTLDQLNNKLSFKDADKDGNDVLNRIADNVEKMASKSYDILDMWKEKIKNNIINELGKFLRENTIGQLQAGWSKYADMTTSVATLKGQGYAMKDITDQLDRLNYFTDETSYNFTSMVSEIGKFTASGQSLEDATTAMMGIAEWAALSGKNASEASRAMYQLSQALGAGEMRLQDYKSIQNLNMDTIEFRKNAIEAAIAAGTLKDNLNGTYTSLVNSKVTFSLQNFAESLTKGKWFNSEVMMTTYKKYSQAVDEIRDIYEEGSFVDAQGNYTKLNTTAEAVKLVQKNNEELVKKFSKTSLGSDEISKLLAKWKKVEKVTEVTAEEYAAMDDAAKEQLKTLQKQQQANYAEYLKEYAETFTNAEKSAEEALEDWHTYVSEYGVKAFLSAQEAKTFRDAIESAKDAASTVWTTIYTNVFGNYDEARELWTDLANSLYEIFVERLWDLNDVFRYWRTGGASALEDMLDEYEKELKSLEANGPSPIQAEADRAKFLRKEIERISWELENDIYSKGERTSTKAVEDQIKKYQKELEEITAKTDITEPEKRHIEELRKEIKSLNEDLENNVFIDGRTRMFQGLYAFGAGFKSLLENIRNGWDQVTEDNSGGKRLLSFSEKLRTDGLRFYSMMKSLGNTSFFRNISQGIKNLFSPITGLIRIIGSAIGQFLPQKQTLQDTLAEISTRFRDITEKIRPSEETLQKLARILRGIISVFRLLGKAALGIWNSIIKPIFDALFGATNSVFGTILDLVASIADAFFGWEKGVDEMGALAAVGSVLKTILGTVLTVASQVLNVIVKGLAPIIRIVAGTVKDIVQKVKNLIGGGKGNLLTNIADGFKNIGDRAKNAWRSTESLADVFNRFRGGSGVGNFLNMLIAMLDNVITKIGNTIAAILGIDTQLEQGKVGHALNNLKDVLVEVGTVIKWVYTNVIRPTLFLLFEGVAACLKDIGDAFKTGDILHILEVITKSIKTIGALELFKVIAAISKVLGSGGLLKVIRNSAKTIKEIGKYFRAKTMNETASAFIKIAVALSLVVGGLVLLTNLPQNKLETLNKLLITTMIAFTGILGLLTLLARSGGSVNIFDYLSTSPLAAAASMFWGITAAILSTIAAVYLLKKAFSEIWVDEVDKNGNRTGNKTLNPGALIGLILGALGPVTAVLGIMFLVRKIFSKLDIVKPLMGLATSIAAISVAVLALSLALKTMVGITSNKDYTSGQIVGAFFLVLGLMAAMTLVAIAASKFMPLARGTKAGLGMAIAVVTVTATTAFIVMPMLEEMVRNANRFPEYMAAIALFASTMLSISLSFYLMTVGTKNGAHMLAAGVVFGITTYVLKNYLVPMLEAMQSLDLSTALGDAAILGVFAILLGIALRQILTGIADIITAISKINAKSWLSIVGSIGAIILGLTALSYLFESSGTSLSTGMILIVLGSVIAILVGFGLFAKILNKMIGSNSLMSYELISILKGLTIFFVAFGATLIGLLYTIKTLYQNNWQDAVTVIGLVSAAMIGVLGVSLFMLAYAIEKIGRGLKASHKDDTGRIKKIIFNLFATLEIILAELVAGAAILKLVYKDGTGYLGTIVTMVGGVLVLIGGVLGEIGIFLTKVPTYNMDNDTIKMITTTFITIFAMIAEIVAGATILNSVFTNGKMFETIATLIGGTIVLLGVILIVLGEFIHKVTTGHTNISNNELATISIVMVSMIVMLGEISLLLVPALAKIQNVPWETMAAALVGISLVIGVFGLIVKGLSTFTTDVAIPSMLAGMAALMLSFWGFAKIIPEIFDTLNKFKGTSATDLIIALGAILIPFYFLTTQIMAFSAPGVGEMFLKTAAEIALGIGLIAAALAALTSVGFLIKDLFGIGENVMLAEAEGVEKGGKEFERALIDEQKRGQKATEKADQINSPSKVYKKYGRFIDLGLAQGITKNRKTVINAASGLALVTNDSFCEELGIASPSKVFYENGRFVVRGFINGMGDETNKNKKAGADMADGFSEGMEDAMNKMKDEFKGIWGSSDLDTEALGAEMGEGLFDSLKKTLLGEDTELTEEEKKKLTDFEKSVDTELAKWEKEHKSEKGTREYDENRAKQKNAIRNRMLEENEEIKKLYERQTKNLSKSTSGTSGGLLDSITSIFSDGISGIFSEDSDVSKNVSGGLSSIGTKISDFFKGDGDLFNGVKESFVGEDGNGGIVGTIKDAVINAAGGENGTVAQVFKSLTGDGPDGVTSAAEAAGSKIGDAFFNALFAPRQGFLTDFLDWLSGVDNYSNNLIAFQKWYESNKEISNMDEDKATYFKHLASLAIAEFGSEGALDEENFEQYLAQYLATGNDWSKIKKIEISDGFFWTGEGKGEAIMDDEFINGTDTINRAYTTNLNQITSDFTKVLEDYNVSDITGDRELQELLTSLTNQEYSHAIATQFSDAISKYGEELYSERRATLTGVDYVLNEKGNYLLKQLIKKSRVPGNSNANYGHNPVYVQNILDDYERVRKIESVNLENIQDGVKDLLTTEDYNKEGNFTNSELVDIKSEATKLGLLDDKSGTLVERSETNKEQFDQLLGYILGFANNGIKVNNLKDNKETKTIYELSKSIGNIDKLKSLDAAARKGDNSAAQELSRITNGLGYNEFIASIDSRYTALKTFMKNATSNDYLNGNFNKWFEEAQYYEKYFINYKPLTTSSAKTPMTVEEWTAKNKGKVLDFQPWYDLLAEAQEKFPMEGETILKFFQMALREKWIEIDQEGQMFAKKFDADMLATMREGLREHSPSKAAIEIMDYFMQGLNIGIDENTKSVLDTLTNTTDLMTDTTKLGMQAMIDSLDDDTIQPTITPVFDGDGIQNGVTAMNRSFEGVNSMVDATVQSFRDDTPNYNGSFATLTQQVGFLTSTVNAFMQMVADGDIVTVNVQTESDPNNIYELVVNTNREKFKQTGKNKLVY